MTLVYITYCIIVNFNLVDIDNWNLLLKTRHLRAADIIWAKASSLNVSLVFSNTDQYT